MFGANLVNPAQICDELSCGQGKVYGRTDGWTDGQTERRRQQQYPVGLKGQGVKTTYKFCIKMGVLPNMCPKRTPFGAKRPPVVYCPVIVIHFKLNYHLISEVPLRALRLGEYLSNLKYCCGLLKFDHRAESCLCDKYRFIQISDHFDVFHIWHQKCTCTLWLTSIYHCIYSEMQIISTTKYRTFVVNIS